MGKDVKALEDPQLMDRRESGCRIEAGLKVFEKAEYFLTRC